MKTKATFLLITLIIVTAGKAPGQSYSDFQMNLLDEHVYQGMPSYDNVRIREAYILSYNFTHRVPNWVAYHIRPDYTNTVPRYNIFDSFRVDPSLWNPVRESEYRGLYDNGSGFAKGHLAPYNISGGDRDGDGLYGVRDVNGDGTVDEEDMKGRELYQYVDDADEVNRVYQINYLSNVAPQDHDGFNGGSGIWRKLEIFIQDTLVDQRGLEVWVIAGPVFGPGPMQKVGPNSDITVPPMFFKMVVREDDDGTPLVLAFLLPHHREPHGEISDYLVSVDIIEAMTGFDFFREMKDETEEPLERVDTWVNWKTF